MKGSVYEENFFIVYDALVLITSKEKMNWMIKNGYSHGWLLPFNILQDGTSYAGRPVGNKPKFTTFDNLLNCDILHSLRMFSVLRRYIVDGEETD